MDNLPKIELKILDPRIGGEFPLPHYASPGAAGLDLRACPHAPLILNPNEVHMVPSGVAIHIADPGYVGVLLPRSGLGAKHGIVLGNLCGVIDSDYTGEIVMALWNRGTKSHTIEPGERVCQLLILPVVQAVFNKVTDFTISSERQVRGFGSTGSK